MKIVSFKSFLLFLSDKSLTLAPQKNSSKTGPQDECCVFRRVKSR